MNKEKLKVKIFAGYSVIPMLFTLTFSILYRNSKKDKE